jgi:hypothetical protein
VPRRQHWSELRDIDQPVVGDDEVLVTAAPRMSEADGCAYGRLDEGGGHLLREEVNGLPARAVSGHDAVDVRKSEGLDGGLNDRFDYADT